METSGRGGERAENSMCVTMTASPQDHEPSGKRPGGCLRLAVVGENADELGTRLAERYGLVARSMDELMKGRKGRKTDNVKAKAASEWLAAGDADVTIGK